MPEEKKHIPQLISRASFDAGSINLERRTIDVVFATEAEITEYDWDLGLVRRVLVCDSKSADISRLNNGAPLLDTHRNYSVKTDGLGVIEKAWFDKGVGRATIRFSKRAEVEPVWQDVTDGIITGVSVGAVIRRVEVTEEQGKLPLCRCTKWEAREISMALVQADAGAAVGRSEGTNDNKKHEAIFHFNTTTRNMENEGAQGKEQTTTVERTAQQPAANTQPAATPAATTQRSEQDVIKEATRAEKARQTGIDQVCRVAGISDNAFIQGLKDSDKSLEVCRTEVINRASAAQETETQRTIGVNGANIQMQADEKDKFREAAINGLSLRSGGITEDKLKPEQVSAAREFRGQSLVDIARNCLIRSGMNAKDVYSMSKMDMVARAITSNTADLPVLLEGTTRRTLLDAFKTLPDVWRQFCDTGSVSDFRTYKRLRMGSFGNLDTLPENAEYKYKPLTDADTESIKAITKGNMINVSRQMIINDDLDAIMKFAKMLGRAAKRSIEADVFALLAANGGNGPVMGDGVALFNAAHGNLIASGSNVTVASMDVIAQTMGVQMDKDKNEYLTLRPSILLTSLAQAGEAKVINEAQYDVDGSPNKFMRPNKSRGLFDKIIGTPRITGNTWYAFADPDIEPVIEVVFLDGVQEPYLESKEGWSVDGTEWKVRFDYGVGAIGWRGVVKNPGA